MNPMTTACRTIQPMMNRKIPPAISHIVDSPWTAISISTNCIWCTDADRYPFASGPQAAVRTGKRIAGRGLSALFLPRRIGWHQAEHLHQFDRRRGEPQPDCVECAGPTKRRDMVRIGTRLQSHDGARYRQRPADLAHMEH